jgi:(p)ppGpp synthase/HD superfamily hydrolase
MTALSWIQFCCHQHDVVCNQKYDEVLPYSQHLHYVDAQYHKFSNLLPEKDIDGIVRKGCFGHDLIEDARVTYNDILAMTGYQVAEIIYACTEDKGRNRDARHSERYYKELAKNELACFVKLCDIMANVKYSILTNSSMLAKHKAEHTKTVEYIYPTMREKYGPMCDHLNALMSL